MNIVSAGKRLALSLNANDQGPGLSAQVRGARSPAANDGDAGRRHDQLDTSGHSRAAYHDDAASSGGGSAASFDRVSGLGLARAP
jgi:hypothetical protein